MAAQREEIKALRAEVKALREEVKALREGAAVHHHYHHAPTVVHPPSTLQATPLPQLRPPLYHTTWGLNN